MYRSALFKTSALKMGVPIVQEDGWAPGPVWKGAENLAPIGIRSPDRPVRSELLYRLRYPGHNTTYDVTILIIDNRFRSY